MRSNGHGPPLRGEEPYALGCGNGLAHSPCTAPRVTGTGQAAGGCSAAAARTATVPTMILTHTRGVVTRARFRHVGESARSSRGRLPLKRRRLPARRRAGPATAADKYRACPYPFGWSACKP